MRVDGKAFRRAREEIRKNSGQSRGKKGKPSKGTQEWLASVATILNQNGEQVSLGVRTIQYLEKGQASIQTVDAVSPHLGLNGRSLIQGYGEKAVEIKAPGIIDLRPESAPSEAPLVFYKSPLMMSVDPLTIQLNPEEIENALLEGITANFRIGDQATTFRWLYQVQLNPSGSGWLGIEREVSPVSITTEPFKISVMFRQTTYPQWSWAKVVNEVEESKYRLIKVNLKFQFSHFTKELDIGIATSQLATYFQLGREKRNSTWPFMAQPDTLTWSE